MKKKTLLSLIFALVAFFALFHTTFAHEVYVLSPAVVRYDVAHPSPNPMKLVVTDHDEFAVCAILGVVLVLTIFFFSISRKVEDKLSPFLMKIKRYAPVIVRFTLGLCFIAAAYYKALFGPEIPLTMLVGSYAPMLQIVLYVIGILVLLGLFVRESAVVALLIFLIAIYVDKSYMLTYVNYLGEIIAMIILGGGAWSLDRYLAKPTVATDEKKARRDRIEQYAFPILRVLFGIAILYASWYAKLFHSELALDTVNQYHLTNYFHFAPLFIVLGALIIETFVGLFFILGVEIRFTALFFLFFLSLSLAFFGETVWPHIVLFGINIAFIFHGYDKYSLEGRFFKKGNREPVL